MTVVTLRDESLRQGGFYCPQFEVRIAGVGLPQNVLRDVIECTYKDNVKEIDSLELTVNNWNADRFEFKYVGAETDASLREGGAGENPLHRLFEPCNKTLTLKMGYAGDLRTMMTGTFTTMEPSFSSSGASTLRVRGLNVLHQLRRKQYTTSWVDKKDSEIAESIAGMRDSETGSRRFPLPIVTDDNAKAAEPSIPYVAQRNQYDIDFLLMRARQRGYVVFVREREDGKELYFGPSQGGDAAAQRDVTFKLAWGSTLTEFKPTLTTANQVRSVTVHGWNRRTRRPIVARVDLNDRRLSRNRDLYRLLERCDPREERVVDEPVFTPQQARQRAIAILMDQQKQMVTATGATVGLADLRAGRRVYIDGVGSRFGGTYFVTATTHTISDAGYVTRFDGRREDGSQGGRT